MNDRKRKYNPTAIRELRVQQGLSLRGFGAKIQAHPNLIMDWESGRVKPSMATMEKIMAAFNIDESIFFTG